MPVAAGMLYSMGYRLGPRIGKGSYAKVKVAERLSDNKIMAIKIVTRRRAAKEFLNKFLPRELSVMLSLNHRNIIRVYEIVQAEDIVCVMMEYASCGDLLDYIKKRGVLKEDEAAVLFAQVIEGVNYLHNRNICHRDLKCENILLRRNMTVALSDFGFSRSLPTQNTLSSTYCGSAAYASPELLRGTPYSPMQNDIWSLGCIIFIMVTGQMPFCDTNTKKMMYRQLKGKVNFPDHRPVSIPCRSLIASTLEPNTDLRLNIKAVLSHTWLQPFVHTAHRTFKNLSEQQATNRDSSHSTIHEVHPVKDIVNGTFSSIITSSEMNKRVTEKKDMGSQNSDCNTTIKTPSLCSHDSASEIPYAHMFGNMSLCRMPGEACLFHDNKERDSLTRYENHVSKIENKTTIVLKTISDQRAPSELSVDTNPSNSILCSSTSIDRTILPNVISPTCKNPQNSFQEISKDTVGKTGDKNTDQNFKIRIQQILQIPFSKTDNLMSSQDQLLTTPSSNSVSYRMGKNYIDSLNASFPRNVDLTQSVSMTRVHQLKPQTIPHKFMFSTTESTSVVKQFKQDITIEQTHIYQAGLVTQMRRIFESKNAGTSTNDRSPLK